MMMMNGNSYHHQHHSTSVVESLLDGFDNGSPRSNGDGYATIPVSSCLNSSPSPFRGSSSPSGANYIEHKVSKMDTLAGVAIKYGVEVADIRRMNGLVTDLQMFALDVLKIPLPGRHPPSPVMPNGSATNGERTPPLPPRPHDDVLDALQSFKLKPPRGGASPAMGSLRGYYGLTPPRRKDPALEAEMSVYKTSRALDFDHKQHMKSTAASDPGLSLQRKSRSMVSLEDSEMAATESIRRRQKGDADSLGFFERIGRGLALRPKPGSRVDADAGRRNSITATAGDFLSEVFVSLRKSSSTSSLQETTETASASASSVWSTSKWSLKTDSITRPILDGFTMPMTARKSKAALD